MVRKTLVLGVVVLAGLAAAAPALLGFYLEREFDTLVARLERPGMLQVQSQRFERGWFSSQADIRVALDGALCPRSPCVSVMLDTTIHHGPIPFGAPRVENAGLRPSLGVAVTRLDPAELWPRRVFEPALLPLRVVTRVGFEGHAQSRFAWPGQTTTVSRERPLARIEHAPVTGGFRLPLAEGPLEIRAASPRFRIVGENGGQLSWRGLEAAFGDPRDNKRPGVPGGLLRAESVQLDDGLGLALRLESPLWQWQPLPGTQRGASGRLDARIRRALVDNDEYGPFRLSATVRDLRPAALRALAARLGTLRDAATGAFDPVARAALYEETIPAVLAGGPMIDIERLELGTPKGEVRAHLRVEAPQALREARLLADVIAQLNVDFAIRLPAPLAHDVAVQVMLASGRSPYTLEPEDVERALAELTADGLIEAIDDGAAYRLRLSVDGGRMRLNGANQIGWQAMVDRFEAARERL